MSALTDLFTAMANKIRSKTGTATTYTPSEMASDGIDDVYDAGVASATTPITPSNSSPASMTANTGYKPTANGYAIASYSSVTPSNVGDLVSSGDIVKFGGSGVVVDDIAGITPSDSNPVTLYMGHYYGMGDSGYAIASYSTATPSNSSPAYVESGKIYKMSDYGHVIFSYTNITPSSTPVTVYTDQMVHVGGSGVIVDSVPTPTSITPSNSSPVTLTADTPVNPTASGVAIAAYADITPSTTNRSYASLSVNSINRILTRTGYVYGALPTGRNLFSYAGSPGTSKNWTKVSFAYTAYDIPSGVTEAELQKSIATLLDEHFAHISNGELVVDRAIPSAYLSGVAYYGRTSSGTAIYSGIEIRKNGTAISGASIMGTSTTNPRFYQVPASFEVGDVISVYGKLSASTSVPCIIACTITTA